ncbi:MAG: patatin [Hymenobacter sp.]|nr:MAG: patatin [Hymenobacter sp.]
MQKKITRTVLAWLLVLLSAAQVHAQKVGLVLSGGGAKGLAHVGVLKQLEANGIPVDYIIGTSMGAIIGAMYSAGYSPREIEQIVLSPQFQYWASGKQLQDKTFNYLTAEPDPSALRLGIAIDSTLHTQVSANLVSDLNLNFALARLLAPAGATCGYDFDKLFVPFRCMAAEVFTRTEITQKAGNLADAVRNSMTFPLAFRPIRNPDGRYLFDGAVFNNFPVDVMRKEFHPDIIIGVNVGDVAFKKYPYKKADELITSTLAFLGTSVADTTTIAKNGIYIQPNLQGLGAADFDKVRELVGKGDTATQRKMALIRQRIGRRVDTLDLQRRRLAFQRAAPTPRFVQVKVQGLRSDQNSYAEKFFRRVGSTYNLDDLEEGYYRLAADDFFRNIYPRISYDPAQKGYVFSVDAQQNNNVATEVGFALSTRPIDNLYFGIEFKYLRTLLYSVGANVSLGRFYNGAQGNFRINVPGRFPFFVQPQITYNQWDYQNTGGVLGRDVLSTQVRQQDTKVGGQLGISPSYRARVTLDVGAFYNVDNYSETDEVNSADVLARTSFKGATAAIRFARNSLNRKQYAYAGRRYVVSLRGVTGEENYTPGTTSALRNEASQSHQWLQLRAAYERYVPLTQDKRAWGYFGELVLSGQDRFLNYRSSLTTAPVFAPLVDSRTLFLDNYRSPRYAAVGLRYTQPLFGSFEWRSEIYTHLNFSQWDEAAQLATLGRSFSRPYLTGSTGLIFTTPVGPLAVHATYYDDPHHRFAVYGHLGYILFRSRALD